MKKIFIILFYIISMCFYANAFTQPNWQNPMFTHTTTDVYLSSQYMNDEAYSSSAGSYWSNEGFSSYSSERACVPQNSYSGGLFNTSPALNDGTAYFKSTSSSYYIPIYKMEENNVWGNPIIGTSTYADDYPLPIICTRCGTNLGSIIIHDRGQYYFRNRYSLKDGGNFWGWLGSLIGLGEGYDTFEEAMTAAEAKAKEILDEHLKTCKETHDAPVGDVSLGIFLMFLIIYYIVKRKKLAKV